MPLITTSASTSSVTDIAPTGDNHFVVVWEEASPQIISGRIITATGEISSDRFEISPGGGATLPAVTVSGDQNNPGFAVAWNDTTINAVKLRVFEASPAVMKSLPAQAKCAPRTDQSSRDSNQIVVAWASRGLGGEGLEGRLLHAQGHKARRNPRRPGQPGQYRPARGCRIGGRQPRHRMARCRQPRFSASPHPDPQT